MATTIVSQNVSRYSGAAVLNFFTRLHSALVECDSTNNKVIIDGGKMYITFGSATSSGITY